MAQQLVLSGLLFYISLFGPDNLVPPQLYRPPKLASFSLMCAHHCLPSTVILGYEAHLFFGVVPCKHLFNTHALTLMLELLVCLCCPIAQLLGLAQLAQVWDFLRDEVLCKDMDLDVLLPTLHLWTFLALEHDSVGHK